MPRRKLDESRYRDMEARLYAARVALEALLPEQVSDLLSNPDCTSREDVFRWRDEVTEKVLQLAQPLPGTDGDRWGTGRAYCPACGGGTSSPDERGFSLPNGLLIHLRGERSAHECPVVRFFREYELDEVSDPETLKLRAHLKSVFADREAKRSNKKPHGGK